MLSRPSRETAHPMMSFSQRSSAVCTGWRNLSIDLSRSAIPSSSRAYSCRKKTRLQSFGRYKHTRRYGVYQLPLMDVTTVCYASRCTDNMVSILGDQHLQSFCCTSSTFFFLRSRSLSVSHVCSVLLFNTLAFSSPNAYLSLKENNAQRTSRE